MVARKHFRIDRYLLRPSSARNPPGSFYNLPWHAAQKQLDPFKDLRYPHSCPKQ